MKPLFENKTIMDGDSCKEFLAITWNTNTGLLRILLIAIGAIAVAYGIVQLALVGTSVLFFAIILFILGAICVVVAFLGYYFRVGSYVREQQKLWGENTLAKAVFFYEDALEQETKFGHLRFRYDQISKIGYGKSSIVLFFGNQAIILDNNGFDGSTLPEFKDFIRGKRKNAKK